MSKSIVNMKAITGGAKIAAGFASAGMLTKLSGQTGSTAGVLIPLLGASLAYGFLPKAYTEVAVGMAGFGVINAIRTYAKDVAATVGLSGSPAYAYPADVNLLAGARRLQLNGVGGGGLEVG